MYDRLVRESATNVNRYGFLTKADSRFLFADSIDTQLKEEIATAKTTFPEGTHHLQVYHSVLNRLYNVLPATERHKWEQMADEINSGNGSEELKAK